MTGQVEAALQALDLLHGLGRDGQQLYVCDPVQPVVGHVVVLIIVADQVIAPVGRRDLVGVDDVRPDVPGAVPTGVELLVGTVAVVGERDLPPLADGFVQHLDGVKQLLAVEGQIRHGADVPHPGPEIPVGQALQLADQLFTLTVRNVLGEQQAVDEQPQLTVCELPDQIKIGEEATFLQPACSLVPHHAHRFAVLDLIAVIHQVHQVPLDGFAVHHHIVFVL